jgi:hypothetical protein
MWGRGRGRGGGWVGFTIQHYFQGLRSHLQKHDQQVPKNQCRLTHDLINFELTHVPTMIFFRLLLGEVLKNGMADHIFLSSFPLFVHTGIMGKKGN